MGDQPSYLKSVFEYYSNLSNDAVNLVGKIAQGTQGDPDKTRETYGIPEGFEPAVAVALGYLGDPDTLPDQLADLPLDFGTLDKYGCFVGSHAIVIGYGRFGQTVAQMLIGAHVQVTLVDEKVDQIDIAEEFGFKVYYGDGTRIDILRQAGGANARLIAFCATHLFCSRTRWLMQVGIGC